MRWKEKGSFLQETFEEWKQDNALQWGAALAYYAALSLAPLLLILLSVAGALYSRQAVAGRLVERFETSAGPEAAGMLTAILENASRPGTGSWAALLGFVFLLLGASGLFTQLKGALDHLWGVDASADDGDNGLEEAVRAKVMDRLLAFGMVLLLGVLVLVAMLSSTLVSALAEFARELLPVGVWAARAIQLGSSVLLLTLVVALIFKILPSARVAWRDVWVGALATAVLFVLGQWLLGFYLSHGSVGSAYGAAGSLIVLLVWIYYSAQILFFGAELSQVWARRYGSRMT